MLLHSSTSRHILAVFGVWASLLLLPAKAATTLRLGVGTAPLSSETKALQEMARLVLERSGGDLRIDVFDSDKLGGSVAQLENLQLGSFVRRKHRAETTQSIEDMYGLFPRLKERNKQAGGTLSGGEAQMLAIARALMSRPKILMLDEPSLGLAPQLVLEMFKYLKRLHAEQGLTILLVEQQARLALQLAERAYILERGSVKIEGKSKDLINDPRVAEAYLGTAS